MEVLPIFSVERIMTSRSFDSPMVGVGGSAGGGSCGGATFPAPVMVRTSFTSAHGGSTGLDPSCLLTPMALMGAESSALLCRMFIHRLAWPFAIRQSRACFTDLPNTAYVHT